jgi:hypothetical protein
MLLDDLSCLLNRRRAGLASRVLDRFAVADAMIDPARHAVALLAQTVAGLAGALVAVLGQSAGNGGR